MKKISILAIASICMLAIASCDQKNSSSSRKSDASLTASIDSASYAIGISYGARLYQSLETFPGGEANVEALIEAFSKSIRGDSATLVFNLDEAEAYFNQYLMNIQMKEFENELALGNAFLAENRSKEGVITTQSGLQYKVIKEGDGPKPVPTNTVTVHYTGKLLDGTIFDSSIGGEPAKFGVTQVIGGWTEGLQIMPVGSKYMFWIPSELAYGPQGAGQMIKPNSTLEFEVELLGIE